MHPISFIQYPVLWVYKKVLPHSDKWRRTISSNDFSTKLDLSFDKIFQSKMFNLWFLQVLAEREWELASLRKHTEDIFHLLYPEEPQLRISGLQNEFHFDLPLSYKVEEALIDTGLVFVLEKEVSFMESLRLEILNKFI